VRAVAQDFAKKFKTEFSEKDLQNGKFGFCDIRASQLEPSDLRGLPYFDNSNKTTKWYPPSWLPTNPDGKGVLFLDELNLAPPIIQSACYQLILDRKLGDYVLPDGWTVISAGNRAEDRSNVFELSSALLNRFVHVELDIPSIENWTKWAMENQVDSRIISFLQFKPMLFKFDARQKDKSFPTPRTWEFASRLVSGIKDDYSLIETLVSSAVGDGVAMEFTAFTRLQKKINLDEILKKPESIKAIEEIDLKYSVVSGLAEKYKADNKVFDSVLNVCKFIEPEFGMLLLGFVKNSNLPKWKKEVLSNKIWINELSQKYAKYLLE
jgi:hypothetical protein